MLADITDASIVWSTVHHYNAVVVPDQEGVPLSRAGGVQVTDRPWPLSVAIRDKNGKSPSMHDMMSHISSYSWTAYGGPQAATIQVSGSARALQSALAWNDHSILISDRLALSGGATLKRSRCPTAHGSLTRLSRISTTAIRTHDQPFATSVPSEWIEDAASIERYGRRELSVH